MPRLAVKNRFALYFVINLAFALLLGIAYGVGGPPNPRLLYLILLFALCSNFVIDIDGLNGRYALLGLFMLVYFVCYGVGDFSALIMGGDEYGGDSFARVGEFLSKTEVVVLLGGIVLVLGYRLAVLISDATAPKLVSRDWPKQTILIVGPIFWAIGTYATYMWYVHIVPDVTNEAIRKGLSSISTLAASAYILAQMLQPLGVLLFAYAYRSFGGPLLLPIVIGIVVLQVLLGFVVDIKGLAMVGGVMVIVTSVLIGGRLPKSWLAAFLIFVVFVFPVFQAYRTAIHGDLGLARTTVVENFGKVLEKTLAATEKVNSGRNRAQTALERYSLKDNTEIIVEKTGDSIAFQDGHTLSPLLATFVPKIVWSDKPDIPTGQVFNKAFHITDSDDVFISPSHLGELYWNFGWPGVLLGMAIIGLMCGWVGAGFNLAEFRTVTRILVTVVTIKQLILGFEGTIASIYVVWLRSLAGIGVLHLILARVPVASRLIGTTDAAGPVSSSPRASRVERLFPNLMT